MISSHFLRMVAAGGCTLSGAGICIYLRNESIVWEFEADEIDGVYQVEGTHGFLKKTMRFPIPGTCDDRNRAALTAGMKFIIRHPFVGNIMLKYYLIKAMEK